MTILQLQQLIEDNKIDRLLEILKLTADIELIQNAIKQYKPELHDVFDPAIRKDKPLYRNAVDKEGNNLVTVDNEPIMVYDGMKAVQRIAFPIQKQIVLLRSAFIGEPKIQSSSDLELEINLVKAISKIWHDNKMNYRFAETKERAMSELKCAWLMYNVEEPEYWDRSLVNSNLRPKIRMLSYELGDEIYSIFNAQNELIVFARCYTTKDLDETLNDITTTHLEVYTTEFTYFKSRRSNSVWLDSYPEGFTGPIPNKLKKIPVILFQQSKPEWADVQSAANRIDFLVSTHAETNNYFGNPILAGITDETISLPGRDDSGKYVELKAGSDLKYVTWDNAPESIKMELENLFKIVYELSNTPNISFEQMKGIGAMSGFAIQLLFLSSTLKAKHSEMSVFGEGVQRYYNYQKSLIGLLDSRYKSVVGLEVKPEFISPLPTDVGELLTNISTAIGSGIMSKESGLELNTLVSDVEEEKKRIEAEVTANQTKIINNEPYSNTGSNTK